MVGRLALNQAVMVRVHLPELNARTEKDYRPALACRPGSRARLLVRILLPELADASVRR